ncbi:hypothetical protein OAN91_03805 [Pelagibacteraceae bacterium]|nr:hypothetical protein [Pelagibacteraceae bacterium]
MKIKKTDISSIFPIIIKIIKLILEDVNKFEKSKFSMLKSSELTVLVKANIDNLKDFSKLILSSIKKLDKINKLRKKEIKIKKDTFTFSSVILLSVSNIVLLITLFGLISFKISEEAILIKI